MNGIHLANMRLLQAEVQKDLRRQFLSFGARASLQERLHDCDVPSLHGQVERGLTATSLMPKIRATIQE